MFRKIPFILMAIILLIGLLGQYIPINVQLFFYSISVTIKSLIVFLLPFVVFGLLFKTAVHFSNAASKLILFMLFFICGSNFISTLVSYIVGDFAYHVDFSMSFPKEEASFLTLWDFSFPKWIANDQAMFSGLILGTFLGWLKPNLAKEISGKLEEGIKVILKGILFVIPLFIIGFAIKMKHDQIMTYILRNYSLIFLLIASAVFSYIGLLYFIAEGFQLKKTINSIRNMLPAAVVGFGTMSSAAAMPLTILGAEKNSKNLDLTRSVIPITVNIHLIGDCFAIPIFAFAIMKSFGVDAPSFFSYLIFASYFVIAKFSVAAVPGGGILVMIPILEAYLGFNAEMLSLITALYILFDPVITTANIMGNGGFALLVEKILKKEVKGIEKTDAFA